MTAGQPRLFAVQQEQLTSDDYYTPAWVFERMGIEFDLDVCAPPGGIPWIPAKRYYTLADDGLLQPWYGRVWMNPPYSNTAPWAQRFMVHRDGVALVPCTKSAWTSDLINAADAIVFASHDFEFTAGEIAPKGHVRPGQIIWPVWFAAFGEECAQAIGRLGVVRRIA